jgi:hypothetical protein
MKIETKNNMIVLKEVYNTILLETEAGKQLYVCMRDGKFEISIDGKNWTMTHTAPQSIDAVKEITRILNEELNNAKNTEDIPTLPTPNIEKWDYKVEPVIYPQKDWNETLIVKLNKLSVNKGYDIVVLIPNKFKPLIESLERYDPIIKKIGHRFNAIFVNEDSNIIMVGYEELEIVNYQ